MSFEIGERLKAVRLARGLSQRQLAKRSGVANATISQIESNRLNPTVGALKRLLDGVPISLSAFFEIDIGDGGEEQIFFSGDDLVELGDGPVSFRQIGANLKDKAIQFLHEKYQPGAGTGKISLSHEGEECGLILKGRLEVQVGGRRKVLGPGDAYYFDSRQPHSFRNPGQEVCEVVTACTPPSF